MMIVFLKKVYAENRETAETINKSTRKCMTASASMQRGVRNWKNT